MGIVHRDLKVENVMLSTAGRARILDFGLVKNLNESGGTQTVEGAILGTLRAMSPEQALGQPVDSRSDIFSLGTLLYECLSGIRPFEDSSAVGTLQRVATHAQDPVRVFQPEVPPELSELIDRLLSKVPSNRPDATWVADRLSKLERVLESVDSGTAAELVAAYRLDESEEGLAIDLAATTLNGEEEVDHEPGDRDRSALLARRGTWLIVLLLFLGVVWSSKQASSPEADLPNQGHGRSSSDLSRRHRASRQLR